MIYPCLNYLYYWYKRFLKGRWKNTGILDCYWSSKHRFSGIPLKCHRGLVWGFLGFFLCVLFWFFLIFPRVTEFREWGGIILCPTCEWLYLLAMWVEMKLLHTSFSDQSLRFGDSLLLPDAVLMSILLAGFPLQMWQWTCVDGIKWHTCPDLKRSCFTPAEDLLKNSFLCWFGGGWMADNDQKQKCHYSFCSPFYQHNNACTVQGFSFSPLLSIHFKPSI